MGRKLIDLQVDFFKPLWRRVAVVVLCGIWVLLEFLGENFGWVLFSLALTIYCCHQFFFKFGTDNK